MGSANNCYFAVFLMFSFCISSFNMDNSFVCGAISDRSVGKDQSCFGKKCFHDLYCRLILCFLFLLSIFLFFFLFGSVFTQNQKIGKKSALTQEEKSFLSWSRQYIVFSLFSLGLLWWTAVNLYSSCKLIVRKLYRFLYFGRKVFFFSVIKDFLSWHLFLFSESSFKAVWTKKLFQST